MKRQKGNARCVVCEEKKAIFTWSGDERSYDTSLCAKCHRSIMNRAQAEVLARGRLTNVVTFPVPVPENVGAKHASPLRRTE